MIIATYLQVSNIINPDNKGGTGNFQISSIKGSNSIDANLIFGTIGMGQYPNILTSTTILIDTNGGSANAGEVSYYIFGFKTISFVPTGSYFRISLPLNASYSVLSTPNCTFLPVLGLTPTGNMLCSSSNGQIIMRGLSQDLQPGTVLSLRLQINNPPQSMTAPLFRVEVMRDKTQYIYDWIDNLIGPNILPGKLSNVTVVPQGNIAELAMGKIEILILTFNTKNPIPQGGMISIGVPTSFAFLDMQVYGKPTTYYIIYGLTASNSTTGIVLQYIEATAT